MELNKIGVILRCGDASFADKNHPENYIHLGYSAIETNKINSGMDIIISQIKKMME
jgi:DNA-binding transcriptional MocR family regulator